MKKLALLSFLPLGLALHAGGPLLPGAYAQQETPADIIAVQIRKQGYACDKAENASRDPAVSSPDEPVWILKCSNASYRVRLVGDLADHVERLD